MLQPFVVCLDSNSSVCIQSHGLCHRSSKKISLNLEVTVDERKKHNFIESHSLVREGVKGTVLETIHKSKKHKHLKKKKDHHCYHQALFCRIKTISSKQSHIAEIQHVHSSFIYLFFTFP